MSNGGARRVSRVAATLMLFGGVVLLLLLAMLVNGVDLEPARRVASHLVGDEAKTPPTGDVPESAREELLPKVKPAEESVSHELSDSETARAIAHLENSARVQLEEANRLMQEASGEPALQRLANEARHRYFSDQLLAAAELLARGSYSVVGIGAAVPPAPPGLEKVVIGPYQHRTLGAVQVVVFVSNDLPRMANSSKVLAELLDAVDDDYVGTFNNLSQQERMTRWQNHLDAAEEVRRIRRDSSSSGGDKRARRIEDLEKRMIDLAKFKMELPAYLLRRRR